MRRLPLALVVMGLLAPASARARGFCQYALCIDAHTVVATAAPGRVYTPHDVAAAGGMIAIADQGVTKVWKTDGTPLWQVRGLEPMDPVSVAFAPDTSLYVGQDGLISHYAADGTALAPVTDGMAPSTGFLQPDDLAVTSDGTLHAIANNRLVSWDTSGHLIQDDAMTSNGGQWRYLATDGTQLVGSGYGTTDVIDDTGSVVKHVADVGGPVAFDPAGHLHLRVVTGNDPDAFWTFDTALATHTSVAANPVANDAYFRFGYAVLADGTNLTTANAGEVMRQAADGAQMTPLGTDPGAGFGSAAGIASAPDGDLLVADTVDQHVARFGPDGSYRGAVITGVKNLSGIDTFADGDILLTTADGTTSLSTVRRVGLDGTVRWATAPLAGRMSNPAAAPDGTAWVRDGSSLRHFGVDASALGTLPGGTNGGGLQIDGAGRIFYNDDVNRFASYNPDGSLLHAYGRYFGYVTDISPDGLLASVDGQHWEVDALDGTELAFKAGDLIDHSYADALAFTDAGHAVYLLDRWGPTVYRYGLRTNPDYGKFVTPPPTVTPTPKPKKPVLSIPKQTPKVRHRSVKIRVTCAAAACRGTVKITGGKRTWSFKVKLAAGASKTLKVKLPKRHRPAKLKVVATVTGGTGATRKLTLK